MLRRPGVGSGRGRMRGGAPWVRNSKEYRWRGAPTKKGGDGVGTTVLSLDMSTS